MYRTARCILYSADRFLLAVHHSYLPITRERWGLPGGRVEVGESAELTTRREISEELGIEVGELLDCGDYRYKGTLHKVFGTRYDGPIGAVDYNEIERIGWHSLAEVAELKRRGRLHTGFELEAIDAFLRVLAG